MKEQAKKELHHRRSIRLAGYDYTSEGGYFITCVTQGRVCLFGEVINGAMKLNDFGEIVKEEWFKTAIIRPNVELIEDEIVVMPNHIHGIIWINDGIGRGTAHNGRGTAHNGRGTAHNGRGTLQRAPTETIEQFGKPVSNSIPTIIRLLKSTTTKQINLLRQTPFEPLWQRNYYEHVIRSDKDYENIADYIYDNPANWEKDDENQLA